eukprot:Phypoly_transcript_05300.p1 GENE.Phypoly_transcript_05300~~Phypoly_transcript_05300.p1  ORF type:complete len:633 (+),score=110.78 Phypoly_transcript_05300:63-1961(+)
MPASAPPDPVDHLVSLIEKGDISSFDSSLDASNLSQNDLVTLLHVACSSAQKEIVEILLNKGVDINAPKGRGRSLTFPLLSALSSNAPVDFIAFLLSKGQAQRSKDEALIYAASHGKLEETRILLNNGATENGSLSPVYAAALRGHVGIIRLLLENSFNANSQNEQGNTPLHALVSKPGIEDIASGIDLLVDAGANVNAENQHGDTPLIKAVRQNAHSSTITRLISKLQASNIGLNTCNKKGYSAFHEAAIWGNIPLMQLLLDVGKVDVNLPDMAGNTALHLVAPQKMNVAHAQFLLQRGADPNAKNSLAATPLHAVGSVEMAEVLVEKGSHLDIENNAKFTPVVSAIERGDLRVAAFLASKNSDQAGAVPSLEQIESVLNIANLDGSGNSIFHKAVEYSGLVKSLLLAISKDKISTFLKTGNASGSTPLHLACSMDSWQTVQLLLDNGADLTIKDKEGNTPLDCALKEGSIYSIVSLLESGSGNVTAEALNEWKDDEGNSLVHKAISCSYPHGIEVLAQKGANMNIPNSLADSDAYIDGGAPLHLAAMMGELECVKTLLDNGADINSKESNEKNTPLHLACYHKHAPVVAELLNRGADVQITNENDEPVLHYAEMGGSSECKALLQKYLNK